MDLVPYMYFERQEPGSQLCAQHCLNNILQQHTYSEFDLAEIAQRLDQAENAELSNTNQNKKSYNLDDTGFFSISVLERALQVWDLTLVRWRGEAMKPYQDKPEDQSAFILHLAQHWLPLRRFAPSPPHSAAVKRWYNMNSFLGAPEWISPTYLKMVLTQAEQEGYSVFVVRKAGGGSGVREGKKGKETDLTEGEGWGDGGVGVLPECFADRQAVELGEPVGRTGGFGSGTTTKASHANTSTDEPSVDPSSIAGPSSPPSRSRRRRQQDLSGAVPVDDPFLQTPQTQTTSQSQSQRNPYADIDTLEDDEDGDLPGASDFAHHSRAYDDEDAAFQAALRASMEDVPLDWVAPDFSKKAVGEVKRELPVPPLTPEPKAQGERKKEKPEVVQNWKPAGGVVEVKKVERETAKEELEAPHSPAEELTQDEIRRRRLAKFGQ